MREGLANAFGLAEVLGGAVEPVAAAVVAAFGVVAAAVGVGVVGEITREARRPALGVGGLALIGESPSTEVKSEAAAVAAEGAAAAAAVVGGAAAALLGVVVAVISGAWAVVVLECLFVVTGGVVGSAPGTEPGNTKSTGAGAACCWMYLMILTPLTPLTCLTGLLDCWSG